VWKHLNVSTEGICAVAQRILTTVVGSYPQPEWLIDRERMHQDVPPRVRMPDYWRIPDPFLAEAQDDATRLAIRDQELAGLDVITDGEIRRESYANRFANALAGLDSDRPGSVIGRGGRPTVVPRVVSPIRHIGPVLVHDVELLRQHTDRTIKITIPGPFTLTHTMQNDYYPDEHGLALDLAAAVNQECRALQAAGADVIQLDEPWMQSRVPQAREYAVEVIGRALEGIEVTTALHTCFGYAYVTSQKPSGYPFLEELNDCAAQQISLEAAQPHLDLACLAELTDKQIILGVLDLADPEVESVEVIAARIRHALAFVPPERLLVAPDCGMKYLPRPTAFAKLRHLVQAAHVVSGEEQRTAGLPSSPAR
jgi:5-methyltetrahydropteroyltriglutamate--homocysteine methyltransferase